MQWWEYHTDLMLLKYLLFLQYLIMLGDSSSRCRRCRSNLLSSPFEEQSHDTFQGKGQWYLVKVDPNPGQNRYWHFYYLHRNNPQQKLLVQFLHLPIIYTQEPSSRCR